MPDNPVNTIDLTTAQAWARKWRQEQGTYNAHTEVNAFLIPKADLIQLLDQGVDAVRAYIGIDDNNVEKLMLVGTKYNQVEKTYDDMLPGCDHDGLIFDFTEPCPTSCSFKSPLKDLPAIG